MPNTKPHDDTPLTRDWIESIFTDETMCGHSLLIDSEGHPIELFLLEDTDNPGVYLASMMQSDPPDSIAITGRDFRTRRDVLILLEALGHRIS